MDVVFHHSRLGWVERCGGAFDNIDDVVPPDERHEFVGVKYKAAAGFAIGQ